MEEAACLPQSGGVLVTLPGEVWLGEMVLLGYGALGVLSDL